MNIEGQSNSAGFGTTAEVTDVSLLDAYPAVPMWHHSNAFLSTALAPVAPIGTNNIGEELKLARLMHEGRQSPHDIIAILKVAEGGTSLFFDWRPQNTSPFPAYATPKGDSWLALETAHAACITALEAAYPNHIIEPALITWAQGEQDAALHESAAYEARLTTWLAALRTLLGSADVFFVCHLLSIEWIGFGGTTEEDRDGVRAAQAAVVGADSNAALIDNDDFTLYNSGHIRPDDTMTKAERTYAAYLASGKAWRQGS